MNKTALAVYLLVLVAATEGRERGAKLTSRGSNRRARISPMWGRTRQYNNPTYQPQTGGPYQPQPTTNTGYPGATGSASLAGAAGGYNQGPPAPVAGSKVDPSLCKYPGFFPTPGSCVNFYRCVDFTGQGAHFTVFQFNCPRGTIFDDELDTCNHVGWTIGKRPECADMANEGLFPASNATSAGSSGPVVNPGGGGYPQPGGASDGSDSTAAFTFSFVCDDQYNKHPKFCNRYYKCRVDGDEYVFPILTCPRDLVFSESMQQCVKQAREPCVGEMGPHPDPFVTEEFTTTDSTGVTSVDSTIEPDFAFSCPDVGYFPVEGDCASFYKCVTLKESGDLKGLVYKCPEEYGFSASLGHCEALSRLQPCQSSLTELQRLRLSPPRQLTVEDLSWFFNN